MLLEQESIRKVVVINADVLSRKTSPQGPQQLSAVGDAASITVVERDPEDSVIHANLKMDGTRNEALMIPAGGFRMPSTPETAVLEDVGRQQPAGQGSSCAWTARRFQFRADRSAAESIESLLTDAGVSMEAVDYFLCHQPNRFHAPETGGQDESPYAKLPSNVVGHFGNSSGVTIPMLQSPSICPNI
jgi:3-oxoacyl-[acyl-carrier-protein] synthase-3